METKQQVNLQMSLLSDDPKILSSEEQQYTVEKYLVDAKKTPKCNLFYLLGFMAVFHGLLFWSGEIFFAAATTINSSIVYKSFIIALTGAILHSIFQLFLILFNVFKFYVQIGKLQNNNNNSVEIIENINNAKTENNFFCFLLFSAFSHLTIFGLTFYMYVKLGWKDNFLDFIASYMFQFVILVILLMLILLVMIIAYKACLKNILHVKTDHPRLCDDQYELKAEEKPDNPKKDEQKILQKKSKNLLKKLTCEKINRCNFVFLTPQHFLIKDKNGKYRRDNLFSRNDQLKNVFNNFFKEELSVPDHITDLITDFEEGNKLKFKFIKF